MHLWRVRHTWNELGRRDPFWAVLTWPDKRGNKWDLQEFLATGHDEARRIVGYLDRVAPGVRRERALDFGCGAGRVSQALTEYFDQVVGVDVAASMIALAAQHNRVPDRCLFEVNRASHLRRFPSGSFDLVYSRLVLQHMPPRLARAYLPELVRVLKSGGALVFQLPGTDVDAQRQFVNAPVEGNALKRALPRGIVRAWRAVKYEYIVRGDASRMDMYGMEKEDVIAVIESAGGRFLDIHDDRGHGTDASGFEYCVTK